MNNFTILQATNELSISHYGKYTLHNLFNPCVDNNLIYERHKREIEFPGSENLQEIQYFIIFFTGLLSIPSLL